MLTQNDRLAPKTELEKLATKEIELTARRRTKSAELAAANETACRALLEDAPIGETTSSVAQLSAEIAAIDLAIATIRSQRASAIRVEIRAEAAKLKTQADAKSKELSGIREKSAKLLKELSAIQWVEYTEWLLGQQRESKLGAFAVPRIVVLGNEIARLEQEAAGLESKEAPTSGGIDLDNVADDVRVVNAVLNERSVGPEVKAVERWLEECEANAAKCGFKHGEPLDRVYLQWRDGSIDRGASYVYVSSLMRDNHPEGAVESATFRAAA